MARVELYGIPADEIDAVADRLAGDLTIDFEGRESGFWGEYRLHDAGGVFEVWIYHNEDPLYDPLSDPPEERYFEPEYRNLRVLLSSCLAGDELDRLRGALLAAFPGTVLIRAEGDP